MLYSGLNDFRTRAGYEIDGRWYPRVTSIISIKSKPGLYMYYASLPNFQTAEAIKNRSAQEGQEVHTVVEALLKGEPTVIPDSLAPTIRAFEEFRSRYHVTPLKVEERIFSKIHHYSGTIDVLAEIDGVVGVLDLKTSQSVYRDYGMQTAAYVQALSEDPQLPPLTSWILRLDQSQACLRCGASLRGKGGTNKIRGQKYPCDHEWSPVQGQYEFKEVADYESNLKAFLAAKTLWEWEHEHFLKKLI